jgi:hypothetical protein
MKARARITFVHGPENESSHDLMSVQAGGICSKLWTAANVDIQNAAFALLLLLPLKV